MADPEFPKGRKGQLQRWEWEYIFWSIFPKNWLKMKQIRPRVLNLNAIYHFMITFYYQLVCACYKSSSLTHFVVHWIVIKFSYTPLSLKDSRKCDIIAKKEEGFHGLLVTAFTAWWRCRNRWVRLVHSPPLNFCGLVTPEKYFSWYKRGGCLTSGWGEPNIEECWHEQPRRIGVTRGEIYL